jgi:hypothetical protein
MKPEDIQLSQLKKPSVRVRDNLSTIQINDEQKQAIDYAYKFYQDSEGAPATKGAFLEMLCLHYVTGKMNNPSEYDPELSEQL